LVWNNGTGSANIKQATIDPRLVNDRDGKHYLTYQAATRALDLKSGDNALVGFDPLKFEPNTLENNGATYAGVTAKGKMLVLSTNTAMTRAAAARELIKAGAEHVVMLDSGASSFLNVRGGDGQMNAAVRSDRNRLVPAAAAVYAR
jgi:Phosphodiester glycosidase